jgi:hypothetical protein
MVENRLVNAWLRRAEGLVISVQGVERRNIAIPDQHRLKWNLWPFRDLVLPKYLS